MRNYKNYLIPTSFLVSIFLFLHFTGTLYAGYHFIDDHKILEISSYLKNFSVLQTFKDYITADLAIRFRPLYFVYYISEIALIGPNFFALFVFSGILATLTFSIFYFASKKLDFSFLESIIFVFIIFLGNQSAIWWRLGTNEPIGMLFVALAFFFMANSFDKKKLHYRQYNLFFCLSLILASLCKESFIIIIPAFVFFKVLNEKKIFEISLKASLKNNWLSIFPLIIMTIELLLIKFVIGTNKIGYAGLTASSTEFIQGVKNIVFNKDSLWYLIILLTILFILYLVSMFFDQDKNKRNRIQQIASLKLLLLNTGFALLIILPNIFMYAKSGMLERYLVPTTLGFSFLVVTLVKLTKVSIIKYLSILIILVFLSISFNNAKTSAIAFTADGKEVNAFLSEIKNSSKPNDQILIVADPVIEYELSYSIRMYLTYFGYTNIYGYPMEGQQYSSAFELSLRDGWLNWFKNKQLENMNGDPDEIVFMSKYYVDINKFFAQNKNLDGKYKDISNQMRHSGSLVFIKEK